MPMGRRYIWRLRMESGHAFLPLPDGSNEMPSQLPLSSFVFVASKNTFSLPAGARAGRLGPSTLSRVDLTADEKSLLD